VLFNSYAFIFLFLPVSFGVYFYLNSKKRTEQAKLFLILSSLFFYSWWNLIYLPLILSSMIFNYHWGSLLTEAKRKKCSYKKPLLIIGIVANLSLLGYFKYADFFITNLNFALGSDVPLLQLALPLAISFFTFQQVAYLVDAYRGEVAEYNFLNYAVFVTFFPQLIAGPIVHHKEMMPQFDDAKNRVINYQNISLGLFIFSIGLFKKVVIADTFAIWATHGFDEAVVLSFYEAWVTSLSYTFQLYFDFSGYADMAIGLALLFNIKLPVNFHSPYKARNIQSFWRRWHMTLSRFLKDYIYIPLGGNRKGKYRTYVNLMLTFILGGIWHGAGWTFIFWGFLHGFALVINNLWGQFGKKLPLFVAWFITFNFVNISWVFFRAKEWEDAIKVLEGMCGLNGFEYQLNYLQIGILLLGMLIVLVGKSSSILFASALLTKKFDFTLSRILQFSLFMFLSIIIIRLGNKSEFLYFNF